MTGLRSRVSVVGIVMLVMLAWPTPASADGYGAGPGAPGYVYDSIDHWYCIDVSFSSGNYTYVHDAMQYLNSSTFLYEEYDTGTCGSLTDVAWINADIGATLGYAPCITYRDTVNHICEQGWAVINDAEHFRATGECNGNANQLIGNYIISVRHELGHTVGLAHVPPSGGPCGAPNMLADDAMVSDWYTGTSWIYWNYNTHHINHVNCRC